MRGYPTLDSSSESDSSEIESESAVRVNMAQVNVELAEKMLIKFDGSKTKLFEFVDNCDKANSIIKPEQKAILFAIIETKLTENARALIRNRTFVDWPALKAYLLDAYSEKRPVGQWQLELNSCKQGLRENVMSYAAKIENCYIKLINSLDENLTREAREACVNLLKSQALHVFVTGLNRDLALIVKSQRPGTLEDAIAIALAEEQEEKSRLEISKYQIVNNSSVKHCTFCNKTGHTSFNCYFHNSGIRNHSSSIIKREQNVRHYNTSPPSSQQSSNNQGRSYNVILCNYCKKPGHTIDQCRKREQNNNQSRQLTCNYCKNPGHTLHQCRKREYNNKMRQNSGSSENSLNPQRTSTAAKSGTTHCIQAEFHE